MAEKFWIVAAVAGWGYVLVLRYRLRLSRKAAEAQVAAAHDLAQSCIDQLRQLKDDSEKRYATLKEWGDRQHRRAEEYFGVFRVVEEERDTWQRLYTESSLMAGNAQAWLLRELQNLTHQAKGLADELRKVKPGVRDVQIDPKLSVALKEFADTHPAGANVPRAPDLPRELPEDPRPA
jgi:hypothetical protein